MVDRCGVDHGNGFTIMFHFSIDLNPRDQPILSSSCVKNTLSLPYNDTERFTQVCSKKGDAIAAVIVEPVAGNMGLVPPNPGFLETLREVTHDHGIVLIFDEVMTGFRVAYGGAQALYGIKPDLTCMGKVIGGGLPVGLHSISTFQNSVRN